MFGLLKKLLADPTAEWPRSVEDPVLGALRLSEDGSWWENDLTLDGRSIAVRVGGTGQPDAALLEHARWLTRDFSAFEIQVEEFLAQELVQASHLRSYAEEVRQLRVNELCFFWPERPEAAMVCFAGPDPYRLWRCEYANGRFYGLAFDD